MVPPSEKFWFPGCRLVHGVRLAVGVLCITLRRNRLVDCDATSSYIAGRHSEDARMIPDLHIFKVTFDPVEGKIITSEGSFHHENYE